MNLPSISVGIDLVDVAAVATSLETLGEVYAKRVFTEDEINYCSSSPPLAPSRFAARFAAKEAALKALRVDDRGIDFRHIEVRRNPGGGTDLALHGPAANWAETAGWTSWALSMSHEGNYAIAMVVAQRAGASE